MILCLTKSFHSAGTIFLGCSTGEWQQQGERPLEKAHFVFHALPHPLCSTPRMWLPLPHPCPQPDALNLSWLLLLPWGFMDLWITALQLPAAITAAHSTHVPQLSHYCFPRFVSPDPIKIGVSLLCPWHDKCPAVFTAPCPWRWPGCALLRWLCSHLMLSCSSLGFAPPLISLLRAAFIRRN